MRLLAVGMSGMMTTENSRQPAVRDQTTTTKLTNHKNMGVVNSLSASIKFCKKLDLARINRLCTFYLVVGYRK